jgi:hypothetical protein
VQMKRLIVMTIVAVVFVPRAFAQDYNHGEIGAFAELFRLTRVHTINYVGVGGRADIDVRRWLAIEGEASYDFHRSFSNVFIGPGMTVTATRSSFSLLHGLIGAKLQTGAGAVRFFTDIKAGALNFSGATCPAFGGCFAVQVRQVPSGGLDAALYLGGGVEAFSGAFGIRADVGDEIYFDRGANNNVKITVGPHFRF